MYSIQSKQKHSPDFKFERLPQILFTCPDLHSFLAPTRLLPCPGTVGLCTEIGAGWWGVDCGGEVRAWREGGGAPYARGRGSTLTGAGGFKVRRSRCEETPPPQGARQPGGDWWVAQSPLGERGPVGVRGWRSLSRPCGALRRPSLQRPRGAVSSRRQLSLAAYLRALRSTTHCRPQRVSLLRCLCSSTTECPSQPY